MVHLVLLLACAMVVLASTTASGAIVEHTFYVENLVVNRLCNAQVITAVNGSFPGPTIDVQDGDTLVVHVYNQSPYNITIHWHGVFQIGSPWADGPSMVTQCPIPPGQKYTYKFELLNQEGTLWWHAHVSWLRATVYGALIIRPKSGLSYPFPTVDSEVLILLGQWWNGNVVDIEANTLASGAAPINSNAYTINGLPGDLYPCSQNQIYELNVEQGETYLFRIINAALNNELFYKIANHNLTVVAVDAVYTKPYVTDVVVVAPGQTVDALLTADQPVGSYYMAAIPYASAPLVSFDKTTTRGIMVYKNAASATPVMPLLPTFYDTPAAHKFYTGLNVLVGGPHWVPVPPDVDEYMFITIGMGLEHCPAYATCQGPLKMKLAASMNNASFQLPTRLSMLQALYFNVSGIYTVDFPNVPPIQFDYTNPIKNLFLPLLFAPKSTSVKQLKFNSTVQMVLQNTALISVENHPIHLHGFNFHVLAQGFGNYDPITDSKNFNLVDPQMRNTIGVPVGGWAVIRFTADNPGVWFLHCHLDMHLDWGMGTVLVVENGPTPSTTLPPPPEDLPQC